VLQTVLVSLSRLTPDERRRVITAAAILFGDATIDNVRVGH
jgi:hypothetical protein